MPQLKMKVHKFRFHKGRKQNNVTVEIPEDFQRVKFTGVNEWTKALRSGKFKQGVGKLCVLKSKMNRPENAEYCCLGVLSKIQGRLQYDELADNFYDLDEEPQAGESLGSSNPLCDITAETMGDLQDSFDISCSISPEESASITCGSLADLNDEGVPFRTIADILDLVFYE